MSEETQQTQSSTADKQPLSIYAVLATLVDQMASIAWQKLGLQHDFITGKLEPDLDQAKVAIDVVAKLTEFLEAECDEQDRRQLDNLVRDLRMNYVSRRSES